MPTDRPPILWLTTRGDNGNSERTRTRMVKGRKIVEKVPQHGHDGNSDYDNPRKAKGQRYVMVVRHEGHIVPLMLTNAAAHLTMGPYAQYQQGKAHRFGWYPAAACPCALMKSGEFSPDCFASDEVHKGEPCDPGTYSYDNPCKHNVAERAQRMKNWNEDQAEKMSGFRSQLEKEAALQREINRELVQDVAREVATIVAAAPAKQAKPKAAE